MPSPAEIWRKTGSIMKKYFLLLFLAVFVLPLSAAGKYTLTAEAPSAVAKGDQFRLSYTVNTSSNVKDLRIASSLKGFSILMGPSRSQSSSTQIINGKVTSSSSITFTYVLLAEEEGTFTIPAATISVDNEKIISNALTVKVLPEDKASGSSSSSSGKGRKTSASGGEITSDQLFVRAVASKVNVYEQEAILLTYKVYTLIDLRGFEYVKLPDFKGFHSQEIDLPQKKQFSLEHYNGRNYNTIVFRQFLLFPQNSGTLEIAPARFDASVMKQIQTNDPFDAFFGNNYVTATKTLMTPSVKINVKPLPSPKPDNFVGAVGTFDLSASVNKKELNANDAVTYKLVLSGVGNLKLVDAPEISFPADFELYDPKVSDNFSVTTSGLSGSKVYEYLAIPRHAGDFTIPSIELSYFDTRTKSYKTLKTESFSLKVNKGKGGDAGGSYADYAGVEKENVKVLANDIRYIHQGDVSFRNGNDFVINRISYLLWYVIPAVIFIVFFVVYRHNAEESMNVAKSRNKRANKFARKRLKKAAALLGEKNDELFYDEVLRTLWGYIADKLNMNTAELTKDNVREKMLGANIQEEMVNTFIDLLNECEFARYAPGNKEEGMERIYRSAQDIILEIESNIKVK